MYKKILIPILFDAGRHTETALETAKSLAAPDATFTCLHVMEMLPAYALSQLPPDITDAQKKTLSARLEALAADLPGAEALLMQGHPGKLIVAQAAEKGFDLIVIASHRPGLKEHVLGSTASRVVQHAPCNVHVLR